MKKETSPLDDKSYIKKIDKSDMAGFINDLPKQIKNCWQEISKMKFNTSNTKITNVVISGMGGSGIGGDLIVHFLPGLEKTPITILREYDVPAYVNKETLFIAVSYSGETEETLSATNQAIERGAAIFAVTGGGTLEKICKKNKLDHYVFEYKTQPRLALGYLMTAVFGALYHYNVINDKDLQIKKIVTAIDNLTELAKTLNPNIDTDKNIAKYLAYACYDRLPVVLSSGILRSVAKRWKCQFNENSKSFAYYDFFPELNHNMAEGLELPEHIKDDLIIILLENSFDHPQVKKRFEVFKKLLDKENIVYEVIQATGEDIWSQGLSLTMVGDYVTYYLALLNKVDPTPVDKIQWTKKQL